MAYIVEEGRRSVRGLTAWWWTRYGCGDFRTCRGLRALRAHDRTIYRPGLLLQTPPRVQIMLA